MEINILGSGTLLSGKKRNPACYLLRKDNDLALLDCGPGCLRRLHQGGQNILALNTIFLSHFHLDHCADVFPLLMARYLKDKTSNLSLRIIGPSGLLNWFSVQASLQGAWLTEAQPELFEIDEKTMQWNKYRVEVQPTLHSVHCIAYRFSAQKSLFYSADTGYHPPLIAFARDADLALLECSFPDEKEILTHLTPGRAAQFAREAKLKKIVLTHIYPENDNADLAARVAAAYNGEIIIAKDFLKLHL